MLVTNVFHVLRCINVAGQKVCASEMTYIVSYGALNTSLLTRWQKLS